MPIGWYFCITGPAPCAGSFSVLEVVDSSTISNPWSFVIQQEIRQIASRSPVQSSFHRSWRIPSCFVCVVSRVSSLCHCCVPVLTGAFFWTSVFSKFLVWPRFCLIFLDVSLAPCHYFMEGRLCGRRSLSSGIHPSADRRALQPYFGPCAASSVFQKISLKLFPWGPDASL